MLYRLLTKKANPIDQLVDGKLGAVGCQCFMAERDFGQSVALGFGLH